MNVAVEAGQSIDPRKGAGILSRIVRLLLLIAGAVGMVTIKSALAMLHSSCK